MIFSSFACEKVLICTILAKFGSPIVVIALSAAIHNRTGPIHFGRCTALSSVGAVGRRAHCSGGRQVVHLQRRMKHAIKWWATIDLYVRLSGPRRGQIIEFRFSIKRGMISAI